LETGFGTGFYKINPPKSNKYQNLNEVGFLPRYVSLAKDGLNYSSQFDKTFKQYKDFGYNTQRLEYESDYELVRALEENCWTSINKCDTKPYNMDNDPIYKLALEYADYILETSLEARTSIQDNEIKMDSAAGVVYSMNRIKKKRDALTSHIFADLIQRHDYIPLAGIATKQEFLSNEDLAKGKVRTTFTSPLDLIMKQKLFFQTQNENIKLNSRDEWIKYGMKKQYGGFDRFMREMENYSHVFQSDASGYDRTVFLLDTYYLRWKHLEYPDELEELLFWTMFHSIFPFCVCPNGLIFMRQCGNNSGANNTASDNSIAHLIIVLYLFIYAYFNKNSEYPTLSDIDDNVEMGLYSDDKLGAADFKFFGWESIEDFQRDEVEVYGRFNMIVKPSSILVTENRVGEPINEKHEFLGSSATYVPEYGKYVAYPRIGKICSSITRKGIEELSEENHFTKIMQLKALSYAEEWLYNDIEKYANFLISHSKIKQRLKQIKELHDGKIHDNMMHLHFGFEFGERQGNFTSGQKKWLDGEAQSMYGEPKGHFHMEYTPYTVAQGYIRFISRTENQNSPYLYMSKFEYVKTPRFDIDCRIFYLEFCEFFDYVNGYKLYGDFNYGRGYQSSWYRSESFRCFYIFLTTLEFLSGGRMDLKSIISNYLMATSRVKRGEQILAALSSPNIAALLPEGKQAIMQRFDPFHDLPSKSCGYPDDYSGSTITRLIKKSVTFNSASGEGTPATGPWNFHVFNTPILTPICCTSNTSTTSLGSIASINKDDTPSIQYGGLMVIRSDNSTFENCPDNNTGNFLAQLALDAADIDATSRLIAQGWELRDNTANIVKQGMITVYRQNEPQMKDFHLIAYDVGNNSATTKTMLEGNGIMLKLPPQSVDDALLLSGSKQWLLKEGVYAVTTFHSEDIPMSVPEPAFICPINPLYNIPVGTEVYSSNIIRNIGWTSNVSGFPVGPDYREVMTIPTTVPTIIRNLIPPQVKLAPINQTGAMCMGAPPDGSYTLTLNSYVEEAVGLENKPFVTLGTQSPIYSPLAMRAMSILTHDSPIAVKVDENYLGEWFVDGMADIAKSVAPWFGNAQTVANQVVKWADTAKLNNGIFQTPQTFVKGSVNNQMKKEKKAEKKGNAVPKAPGPAPMKRAFRPAPTKARVSSQTLKQRAKNTKRANVTVNATYLRNLEQRNRAATGAGYLSSRPKKIAKRKPRKA